MIDYFEPKLKFFALSIYSVAACLLWGLDLETKIDVSDGWAIVFYILSIPLELALIHMIEEPDCNTQEQMKNEDPSEKYIFKLVLSFI